MDILFLHRNFPAQFRHLAPALAQQAGNTVVFLTNNDKVEIPGVSKIVYGLKRQVPPDSHRYTRFYEEGLIHAQGAADIALQLQQQGYKPDIIIGHSWGPNLFMKDIFRNTPMLSYFEWFYSPEGADIGFDGSYQNEDERARIRSINSLFLEDLYTCDAGVSPTHWQKSRFPKEFHDKIKVIADGVDTSICKPNPDAKFVVKDKNLLLTAKDEVLTYVSRGLEPYRGFPEFMQAVEQLLKKRPNLQVVIAGENRVCYDTKPIKELYKEKMLRELDLDMSRVHFVDRVPFFEYVNLLQISSCHVYLTVPFVLSWSFLDAMAVGCCIVSSKTAPVQEVMVDNYNGLLVDFYDVDALADRVNYALDNQDKVETIRKNAYNTIMKDYALKNQLPKQIDYINKVISMKGIKP